MSDETAPETGGTAGNGTEQASGNGIAEQPVQDGGGIADAPADGAEASGGIADGDGSDSGSPSGSDGPGDGKEKGKQPEPYELTAPEDFPLPADNLKSFTEKARELGLTKAQAEGMLQWHKGFHSDVTKAIQQEENRVLGNWGKEIQADKDFGGSNLKATIVDARKALAAFDTDGSLRQLLRETKYQYHPAIIRAVARIGRAMNEHDFVSQSGAGTVKKPLEERMYPNMKV